MNQKGLNLHSEVPEVLCSRNAPSEHFAVFLALELNSLDGEYSISSSPLASYWAISCRCSSLMAWGSNCDVWPHGIVASW